MINTTKNKGTFMFKVLKMVLVTLALLAFTPLAMASDGALPAPESLPEWAAYIIAALYALSHVLAVLPATITSKLPPWVGALLQFVAANYGSAKNKTPDK